MNKEIDIVVLMIKGKYKKEELIVCNTYSQYL